MRSPHWALFQQKSQKTICLPKILLYGHTVNAVLVDLFSKSTEKVDCPLLTWIANIEYARTSLTLYDNDSLLTGA